MDLEKEEEDIELRDSNISLSMSSYNNLFSDFDPRDYSQKILSEDFIDECKRATREKNGKVELMLLFPKNKRNIKDEIKIKKRLKDYFTHSFKREKESRKKEKIQGFLWFLMGAIVMVLATLISESSKFILKLLEIMSVPASWFLFWEGLGKMTLISRERISNYKFHEKMSKANIIFASY